LIHWLHRHVQDDVQAGIKQVDVEGRTMERMNLRIEVVEKEKNKVY
jgi:hypothetical protein